MSGPVDCVVIGAGINGLLTARELAGAGLAVTVLERGAIGAQASWAGGGILSPLYPWRAPEPVTRLAAGGQASYPALAAELLRTTGIDPEWLPGGLLVAELDEADAALRWALARGIRLERLDRAGLERLEPALAQGETGGVWLPDVAQIRNPRLLKALRADLELRGVALREQVAGITLHSRQGRVQAVQTSSGEIRCHRVVVTAGAWTPEVLAGLLPPLDIRPVRGQMLLLRASPGLLRRVVLRGGRYLIPRRDGRVLAGSTIEHAGFDGSTTPDAARDLCDAAVRLVPALAGCPVERHWAGLRPGAPGGVPYIGAHPGLEGLHVNAGQYRNGLVLGPASARLLADLILGRQPEVDPAPYAVEAERRDGFE